PPQVEIYPAHGADFAALADKVRGFKPDGIYLAGYYSDMAQALRELHSLPGSPRILSTSSFGNPKTLESAGQAAEGVIFPAIVFDPESDDPPVARFVKSYRMRYGSNPDLWAAHGYDSVLIASEAIRRAGGVVPERIVQALEGVKDFAGA